MTGQDLREIQQSFFSSWRTSLMNDSLENFKAIASDVHIHDLIETIVIEDDCAKLDPWTATGIPSEERSYDVWPRSDDGTVDVYKIGIEDLMVILQETRLRPRTIRIRDYKIAKLNLNFCQETEHLRDKYKDLTINHGDSESVAAMAQQIIEKAHLSPTSITIEYTFLHEAEGAYFHSPSFDNTPSRQRGMQNPSVHDALIEFSPQQQQAAQPSTLSSLHSATLNLHSTFPSQTHWWLHQILHRSPSLQILSLQGVTIPLAMCPIFSVVPVLIHFTAQHMSLSGPQLLGILSSSLKSLRNLTLKQITLNDGDDEDPTRWRHLLPALARTCVGLEGFSLNILRDGLDARTQAVDFRELNEEMLPEDCRARLKMGVKRYPSGGRRVPRVDYEGPEAGRVLEIAAGVMVDGVERG